jgi:hypothetical protein
VASATEDLLFDNQNAIQMTIRGAWSFGRIATTPAPPERRTIMLLPEFAVSLLKERRCRRCFQQVEIGEKEVSFVGFKAMRQGITLALKAKCPKCGSSLDITFAPPLPWTQIQSWVHRVYCASAPVSDKGKEALEEGAIKCGPAILLDCVPARMDLPEIGEKAAILTVATGDEIHQPFIFNIKDVKRLSVGLLAILSHHGDRKAKRIIRRYFTCD